MQKGNGFCTLRRTTVIFACHDECFVCLTDYQIHVKRGFLHTGNSWILGLKRHPTFARHSVLWGLVSLGHSQSRTAAWAHMEWRDTWSKEEVGQRSARRTATALDHLTGYPQRSISTLLLRRLILILAWHWKIAKDETHRSDPEKCPARRFVSSPRNRRRAILAP